MRCVWLLVVLVVVVLVMDSDAWLFSSRRSSGSSSFRRSSSWTRSRYSPTRRYSARSSRRFSSSSRRRGWLSSSSSSSSRFSPSSTSSRTSRLSSSSRSSSPRKFSYDLNKKGLTKLYNSEVTKVESYQRPIDGWPGKLRIPHTGVVATTKDGGRWLIQKGLGYGKASSTIVADAKHMSNKWRKTGSKDTSGKTISDFMKAGGVHKEYGILPGQSLCYGSSKGIMKEAGRGRRKRSC